MVNSHVSVGLFLTGFVLVNADNVSVGGDCGGVITDSVSTSIRSRNYPEEYPDNEDCEWIIKYPQGENIIVWFGILTNYKLFYILLW